MRTKLGVFTLIAAMSCGAAWAQSNPFAGQTPVKAELKKSFSSKDKPGAEISATTKEDITLGLTKLPKGSMLTGHVVDATKHTKDTPNGMVTIIFEQAKPKKGDPIAITASVYRIMPADDSMQRTDTASGMRGSAGEMDAANSMRGAEDANAKITPGLVSAASAPIQVVSGIPGVALSAVASPIKSGIMTARNSDVDLLAGINLVVGIAPK